MSDEATEIPEIPDFNPKAVRRASRRGVLRVALIAALIVGLVFAAVDLGTGAYVRHRADGPQERAALVRKSIPIAHAGMAYIPTENDQPNESISRTGDFHGTDSYLVFDPLANSTVQNVEMSQSLFGKFTVSPVPRTKLDAAARAARNDKAKTKTIIAGFPASTALSAAVELARPVSEAELPQLLKRLDLYPGGAVRPPGVVGPILDWYLFTPMHVVDEQDVPPDARVTQATGPNLYAYGSAPLLGIFTGNHDGEVTKQLRDYAHGLSKADNSVLHQIGMPSAQATKRYADEGKIYGFTLAAATPEALSRLLTHDEVRSITIADAMFDTGGYAS